MIRREPPPNRRLDYGGGGLFIVWSALLFLAGMQLGQERMADQLCDRFCHIGGYDAGVYDSVDSCECTFDDPFVPSFVEKT